MRMCVCVSYPALTDAAWAGRGGAGRFSRMRSGQLTGGRPVHWRGQKRGEKWSNGGWDRDGERHVENRRCCKSRYIFERLAAAHTFRPRHPSIHMNEAEEEEEDRRGRKRAAKSTLLFFSFFSHTGQNTNCSNSPSFPELKTKHAQNNRGTFPGFRAQGRESQYISRLSSFFFFFFRPDLSLVTSARSTFPSCSTAQHSTAQKAQRRHLIKQEHWINQRCARILCAVEQKPDSTTTASRHH